VARTPRKSKCKKQAAHSKRSGESTGPFDIQKTVQGLARLTAQPQTGDQILVGLLVTCLDIVEKVAALADHRQKTAA